MSKRFGRQQKRKMLQKLAELSALSELRHDMIIKSDARINELQNYLSYVSEYIRKKLGNNHVLLSPEDIDPRVNFVPRLGKSEAMYSAPPPSIVPIERIRIQLEKIFCWPSHVEDMSGDIHFRIVDNTGCHIGYAATRSALISAPPRILANNIADFFVHEVKKAKEKL